MSVQRCFHIRCPAVHRWHTTCDSLPLTWSSPQLAEVHLWERGTFELRLIRHVHKGSGPLLGRY